MALSASVGRDGQNRPDDVRSVQQMLNKHLPSLGSPGLTVDGKIGAQTISAITAFQARVMHAPHPDGRIDPGGATFKALNGAAGPVAAGATHGGAGNLSGLAWWTLNEGKYKNSSDIADLADSFRPKVQAFVDALKAAGASVSVSATLRNPIRAYLMHYSWDIAKRLIEPEDVPLNPGCNIQWVHDTPSESIHAAAIMVSKFAIVYRPSLTSRHIEGLAIDMDISWTGTLSIKNKQGATVAIGAPASGATNTQLHAVGATYGVIKLLSDEPHWSSDGH
jgi:hypothetical protein